MPLPLHCCNPLLVIKSQTCDQSGCLAIRLPSMKWIQVMSAMYTLRSQRSVCSCRCRHLCTASSIPKLMAQMAISDSVTTASVKKRSTRRAAPEAITLIDPVHTGTHQSDHSVFVSSCTASGRRRFFTSTHYGMLFTDRQGDEPKERSQEAIFKRSRAGLAVAICVLAVSPLSNGMLPQWVLRATLLVRHLSYDLQCETVRAQWWAVFQSVAFLPLLYCPRIMLHLGNMVALGAGWDVHACAAAGDVS